MSQKAVVCRELENVIGLTIRAVFDRIRKIHASTLSSALARERTVPDGDALEYADADPVGDPDAMAHGVAQAAESPSTVTLGATLFRHVTSAPLRCAPSRRSKGSPSG